MTKSSISVSDDGKNLKPLGGIHRIVKAIGYSYDGMRHALAYDPAIRIELLGLVIFVPVSILLPVSNIEHLLLVLSLMLVVLVEFLNSSIEAAIDRISLDRHPLSKQAKDFGSAAVFIAILMSGLCWVVIAGPVLVDALTQGP